MNLPNTITLSRIVLIVPILWCLYQPIEIYQWWAWGLFLVASLTDWLDGYLARRLNQVTDLGKFLDPLTDKILVIAPLLVLIEHQIIPAWGVFLILVREITIAGWRVNPQQKTVSGANVWGKCKTVAQISAIALLLLPRYPWALPTGIIVFWLSVILTIVSGLIYLMPPKKKTAH